MTSDLREYVCILVSLGLSVIQACRLSGLSRASYYRQSTSWRKRDAAVIDALNHVLKQSPQSGFWKCFARIRRQGHDWNHKRVYRVYCLMGLNLPRRQKRTLPRRIAQPLQVVAQVNHQWALDFMSDSLYCGKRFRTLNIVDEGTRECLEIEVDTSLPAERVVRALDRLGQQRGLPKQLRVDNGPELISARLLDWCEDQGIEVVHVQPGKPQQNAFIERFNGSFRREFLNVYLFENLTQVREMSWLWRLDYNEQRPHESLGNLPPAIYRAKLENSRLELSQ